MRLGRDEGMDITEKISAENKIYLDEISNRLFTNHAAIMVGAGFSKNAIPSTSSCKGFSSWNELGDAFYDKLYGRNANSPKKEYMSVLKLAEEVEATFGRPVLDDILKNHIPDLEYEPSELHKKLLDLPWIDVFTTNYDTLLERATKYIFNRKYTVVYSKDDLVYATNPRIIKLHGSFLSFRPFTITEEDYRTYPQKNAPFVNTVQQSLLENTLCLIGFSGDDPNFLQWIGWLRDNLESNISKIYLVGAFKLSTTQKKLLEKRNIVLVNLSDNHYDALNIFIEYLSVKSRINNIMLWPYNTNNKRLPPTDKKELEKELVKLIDLWKEERKTYPGWVILPEEKRNSFSMNTEYWIYELDTKHNISDDIKYNFVFELCWRLDKMLYPLDKKIVNLLLSCIREEYYSEKNILLSIYLLKYYRQNGLIEEWNSLYSKLSEIESITDSLKGELDYENSLQFLFCLDYPQLKKITSNWKYPNNTPFENAKKAGILAEIGQLNKAIEIVENSLVTIREQQQSIISSTDCKLLSQESFILDLYLNLIFAKNNTNYETKYKEYKDRVSFLNKYLCNPNREQNHFKDLLSGIYQEEKTEEFKYKFDIGDSIITHRFGKSFKEEKNAFSFLLYCENVGMPFCIHTNWCTYNLLSKEALLAIERIAEYNLIWAVTIYFRIAESKKADILFTRKSIINLSIEYINSFCNKLITILNDNEKDIYEDNNDSKNFAQVLAEILPEIISRLCTKCNTETKSRILKLICAILTSNYQHKYENIDNLIKRFMKSLFPSEIERFFIDILKLPIPKEISLNENKLMPPLFYIDCSTNIRSKISNTYLVPYFEAIESENEKIVNWGILTLEKIFELKLLNHNLQTKFGNLLWRKKDSSGFPNNKLLCKSTYVRHPHPANIEPLEMVKNYLKKIQCAKLEINGVYMSGHSDYIDIFISELNNLLVENLLEQDEILFFTNKVFLLWEENSSVLKNEYFRKESLICFNNIILILGKLLDRLKINFDNTKLIKLIDEAETYNIPCLYLKYKISDASSMNKLSKELEKNIGSESKDIRIEALLAIKKIVTDKQCLDDNKLIDILCFSILYGNNHLVVHNINILINIITNQKEIISTQKNRLLNILSHLTSFTEYKNNNSILSFEEKLLIRSVTMHLAFIINKNLDNDTMEPEIEYWENLSENEDEFSDIRNQWK